jgi:hypothetical protein
MYVVHTIWRIRRIDEDERQQMDISGWTSVDKKVGRMLMDVRQKLINIGQNYDTWQWTTTNDNERQRTTMDDDEWRLR